MDIMNVWKPDSYTARELEKKIKNGDIQIPTYQRGIVWSKSKQDKLIDSIKLGYPFGSILLFQDPIDRSLLLIDGLQRVNTIFKFINNPAVFFNRADVDKECLDEIVDNLGSVSNKNKVKNKVEELLIEWVSTKYKTMNDVEDLQYSDFMPIIEDEFPIIRGNQFAEEKIIASIRQVLKKYKELCKNMLDIRIPILIMEGDCNVLPEVFRRINEEGAKISKQNVYAAVWTNDKVEITNSSLERIIDKVKERYDKIQQSGIDLANYDKSKFDKQKKIDIFELTYGFGKIISEDFPYLFHYDNDPTKVESCGFNLITACLGMQNKDAEKMNIRLKEVFSDEEINKFLMEIINCIKFVDKCLRNATRFKGNTRESSKIKLMHTEMQIVSMIASVFIAKHVTRNFDFISEICEEKNVIIHLNFTSDSWKYDEKDFKDNMLKKYIIDILYPTWRGSGDKKLNEVINNNSYYTSKISWNDFERNLDAWFENVKRDRMEFDNPQQPKEAERILLNLCYVNNFSAADQIDDSKYDIEHLATKSLLIRQLKRFKGNLKLPISSIGNLCYLPEYDNRAKKEETIYNDKKYINRILSMYTIEELESKFTFTEKEDLEWIYDFNISEIEITRRYSEFINKRYHCIKEKIKETIFKNESITV